MNVSEDLLDALNKLRAEDRSYILGGASQHFIEFIRSSNGACLHINGNRAGLVHLAKNILDVAVKNFDGAHHHFDSVGLVDPCDMEVVVCLKKADWGA